VNNFNPKYTDFVDILRRRDFVYLWIGQIISSIGDRFYQFALLSIILGINGAQMQIGSGTAQVFFAAMIFTVILAPWIGKIVDSYSRKLTMLFTDFGRAILLLGLLFVWMHLGEQAREENYRWVILAFVSLIGLLNGVFIPARQASVSALVTKEELVRANALVTTVGVVASVVGASASLLISLLGEESVFFAAAVGFTLSGVFILAIKNDLHPQEKEVYERSAIRNWFHTIHEALTFTWQHPTARALVLLAGLSQFVLGLVAVFGLSHTMTAVDLQPVSKVLSSFVTKFSDSYCFEERHVRLLASVSILIFSAFGLLTGVILCGKSWHFGHYSALPFFGLFLLGLSVVGFALTKTLGTILLLSFVFGFAGALVAAPIDARLQSEVRPNWLGRVFALRAAWMNVAFLLAMAVNLDGKLIQKFGAGELLLFVGIGAVSVAMLFMMLHTNWLHSVWYSRNQGQEQLERLV